MSAVEIKLIAENRNLSIITADYINNREQDAIHKTEHKLCFRFSNEGR